MNSQGIRFTGLQFFEGGEYLPGDLLLDLPGIREWANSRGMISDPEFQLLGSERLADIAQVWSSDDQMLVAISISGEAPDALNYFEFAYVPVRTLIRREMPIELVYWRVCPWPEAQFGFSVAGCADEFCSSSTAKLVVPKFTALLDVAAHELAVETRPDGTRTVDGEGVYVAQFRRVGRGFDVDIRPALLA